MYNIEIYKDKNGKSEIEEYIQYLQTNNNKSNRIKLNKIIAYIRMLKQNGLEIGEPFLKHLEGNIWELRPLRDRILFVYYSNRKFILLNIFLKKTQKTPRREIEKAKSMFEDYIKRSEL